MFLDLQAAGPNMKLVYELAKELEGDPDQVRAAQALTLNASKPLSGLRGNHGLFASDEWWESIRSGRLKSKPVAGVIEATHFHGQDSRWGDQVNGFTLLLDDGTRQSSDIYALKRSDYKLFVPGARVTMIYVLDELKQPAADGGANYLDMVLEMAISRRVPAR